MADTTSPSSQSVFTWLQSYLMEQLRMHGLSMLLLAVAVWYFQGENREMKAQISACNDSLIETYRVNQVQLLDVINNNTRALQDYTLQRR